MGVKDELVERLNNSPGPFGIDLNLPQEEKVLQMIGISDFAIAKYLNIDRIDRHKMLEMLFSIKLNKKSEKILELSTLTQQRLEQMTGERSLAKADMIRKIVLRKKFPQLIESLAEQLNNLGFTIIETPEKRDLKPLTKKPFTEVGAKASLSFGQDPSGIPAPLLYSLVEEYILFKRQLKDPKVYELAREIVTDPPLKNWNIIKKFLINKSLEDLTELAALYNYPKLTKEQIEFLFSRGYLRDVEQITYSERLQPLFEIVKTKDEKKWFEKLVGWDSLTDDELIEAAKANGISIQYPDGVELFWEEAMEYSSVKLFKISLEDFPELDEEVLKEYSDMALIEWFPRASYGRTTLIDEFIDYWSIPKYFYHDNLYFGTPSEFEEIDEPDFSSLELMDLIDLSFWVRDNSLLRIILDEIIKIINVIDKEESELPSQEAINDDSLNMEEIFLAIREMGIVSIGGRINEPIPNERKKVDEDLYNDVKNTLIEKLAKTPDEIIGNLPLVDIISLKLRSKSIKTLLDPDFEFDYNLIDTGNFYLALYYDKLPDDVVTLARSG